jgi:hypothetical protein
MRSIRLRLIGQKPTVGVDKHDLSIPAGRQGAARAAGLFQQGLAGRFDTLFDALHQ